MTERGLVQRRREQGRQTRRRWGADAVKAIDGDQAIVITRWRDRPAPQLDIPAMEAVFFASSATRAFRDDAHRACFHEQWLGRYLDHDAGYVWVAVNRGCNVVGYLVGSVDDPARTARFADVGYFADLAPFTRAYPAHLHVNVDGAYRSAGIGARLVAAFAAQAARVGAPGLHIVTSRGNRNERFYRRLGFDEVSAFEWNGRGLVMLGVTLVGGGLPPCRTPA
jgi:GNAT superfamily N-acetyltransferase